MGTTNINSKWNNSSVALVHLSAAQAHM